MTIKLKPPTFLCPHSTKFNHKTDMEIETPLPHSTGTHQNQPIHNP